MGRRARAATKSATERAANQERPKPTYDHALVVRLFDQSPLANKDVRLVYAETYALVTMQLADLRARIVDGTIQVDEAKTLPSLVNRLVQLTHQLKLSDYKEADFNAVADATGDDGEDTAE